MGDTQISDPLHRRVTLHDRTWFGHIVKGHPEVTEHRRLAEWAISSPEQIRLSTADPNCRLYYGKGHRPDVKMLVVADVVLGVVKTAHLARKISGGALEWSSQNPLKES